MKNQTKSNHQSRRESLLFKYGIIGFVEIIVFITIFVAITSALTKKPVEKVYTEGIEQIIDMSVYNVEDWFTNKVEVLKMYQTAVAGGTTSREDIKNNIKVKTKPNNKIVMMLFCLFICDALFSLPFFDLLFYTIHNYKKYILT